MKLKQIRRFAALASKKVSAKQIHAGSLAFFEHEKNYNYREMSKSADLALQRFRDAGTRAEMRLIKADGVTANLDMIMPECWDAYGAKLEILSPVKEVLSEYNSTRFMLPVRCPATPPEGITGELVLESDMEKKDVRGKFILSFTYKMMGWNKLELIEKGVVGVIAARGDRGDQFPDAVRWTNGWGCGPGWFQTKEEPRLLMINVSYNHGQKLTKLLNRGRKVIIKAFADTRTYSGFQQTATGLIPGKRKQEVVLQGHLYEPMPTDNTLCAAAMCDFAEIVSRLIAEKKLPKPYYSIRFMLGQEKYGFAEFYSDSKRARNVVANMNFDGIGANHRKTHLPALVRYAPVCNTSFSDLLLDQLVRKHNTIPFITERGNFSDDTFMGDPRISAPCNWIMAEEGCYHHQSANTFDIVDWAGTEEKARITLEYILTMAYLDPQAVNEYLPEIATGAMRHIDLEFAKLVQRAPTLTPQDLLASINFVIGWQLDRIASAGTFGATKANIRKAQDALNQHIEKKLSLFRKAATKPARGNQAPSPEERQASKLIPVRLVNENPTDLKREKNFRRRRKHVAYHESFVAWMDGKRDLWTVIKLLEMDYETQFTQEQIKAYIRYAQDIARLGYIRL